MARYRTAKGWEGQELAERAGVDPARVSNWENGVRKPQPTSLQKIANTAHRPDLVLRWLQESGPEPPEVVYGGLPAILSEADSPVVSMAVGEMIGAVQAGRATGDFILSWARRLYVAGKG